MQIPKLVLAKVDGDRTNIKFGIEVSTGYPKTFPHSAGQGGSSVFSYARVESVLAELHLQPPSRLPAFRARLRYLRTLGVPLAEGPGKGKRFEYSREHLWQIALALELSALGIAPDICAAMAQHRWPKLHRAFQRAEKERGPFFLAVIPELPWQSALEVEATYTLRPCTRDEAIRELDQTDDKARRRRSFINLTALVQRIDHLLAQGDAQ